MYSREYYEKNKEHLRNYSRQWKLEHSVNTQNTRHRWYLNHREQAKSYAKKWQSEHPTYNRDMHRKYRMYPNLCKTLLKIQQESLARTLAEEPPNPCWCLETSQSFNHGKE